jgi:hypothetical protein
MQAEAYLDRTLAKYAPSYDLTIPYEGGGLRFEAYGHYLTQDEKYVLTRKVNLWAVRGHEHIVFRVTDRLTQGQVDQVTTWVRDYMEPELVRHGDRYPEKDHMVSWLTVVFLSREKPEEAARKALESYRMEKDYLFTVRGHSKTRLVCADLESETILTNKSGRELKKSFQSTYSEVHKGMAGYTSLYGK